MDNSRGGSAMGTQPDRKNFARFLPEVSVSNAERTGKRPSDLAVSNRLQKGRLTGKRSRKLREYVQGKGRQGGLGHAEDALLSRRSGPLRLEQRAGAGAHGRAWRHVRLPHARGLGRTDRARL